MKGIFCFKALQNVTPLELLYSNVNYISLYKSCVKDFNKYYGNFHL
ncbi:hypothetical protein EV145_107192 [Flavobacterium sp. 245]|nr:hypothetical protein EV145_107192 [Flavobacterium sp. 245]